MQRSLNYSEMFKRLLELYPHPEGGPWNGPRMEDATGGFVNAAYFSNLKENRIRQPGLDKLKAIARAMGFPPAVWLEEPEHWGQRLTKVEAQQGSHRPSLSDLLNNLFKSVTNERTKKLYTNAEIARQTAGQVTEEQLEDMRGGLLKDPTMAQILALSEAFDVDPAYWFRRGKSKPLVDLEIVEALRNEDSRLLLHRSLGLSKGQKDMLLILMEQLEKQEKEDPA